MNNADAKPRKAERVADGDNLLENLDSIDIETWERAQEVFSAFKRGEDALMTVTNDIADYSRGQGSLLFTLAPGVLFSDTKFRKRTYNGITGNEFFFLDDDMAAEQTRLINGGKAVQVPYNGLTISTEGCGERYCFVESSDTNTDADKKLVHAFYGASFPGKGKRVYLLKDSALERALREKPDGRVARACFFYYGRDFSADDRNVGSYYAVRGVRKEKVVDKGDGKKEIMPYEYALKEADKIAPKGTPINPIIVDLINKLYHKQ